MRVKVVLFAGCCALSNGNAPHFFVNSPAIWDLASSMSLWHSPLCASPLGLICQLMQVMGMFRATGPGTLVCCCVNISTAPQKGAEANQSAVFVMCIPLTRHGLINLQAGDLQPPHRA